MRIALAQLSAISNRDANYTSVFTAMNAAHAAGAGLVAFPEIILDPFFPQSPGDRAALDLAEPISGMTCRMIASKTSALKMVTVFNLYELGEDGNRYDSSPVIDADGTLLGVTRMIHITDYEGFHERDYYHPGDNGVPVYSTRAGKVGVAICYDRHYPEVMRGLGVAGAELVVIPQAGTVGEWPEGLYEAEVRTAAFQNGYFAAVVNRVGEEGKLHFAGESFVVDPEGRVIARGKSLEEDLVIADIDLEACKTSTARRLFWRDRRPELYRGWL
jgi:beta-ureidopropionase